MAMKTRVFKLLDILRLKGMINSLEMELQMLEHEGFSPLEFLCRLLEAELSFQDDRRRENRFKAANLPFDWTLESFPFSSQTSVDKSRILSLADLDFVNRRENIVFIGDTGTGKSGLAMGIVRKALENGMRCRFYNAQQLLDDLYASLADRTTSKLLKQLSRYDILVIDELGYLTLKDEQSNAFFKLINDRYSRKSTIITTNLDYDEWPKLFRTKALVAALLDRLKHHCITIRTSGPSLRVPQTD